MPGLAAFARRPDDSDELRFAKLLILIIALSCCGCGLVWSALYWAAFGWGLTMALPLGFVVVVGAAVAVAHRRRNHQLLVYAQLGCITWVSALIGWSIGSIHSSGFVISWSFLGPIGALMFLPLRHAVLWLAQFLVIVLISVIAQPALLGAPLPVSATMRSLFYAMNIGASLTVVFAAAAWFMHRIKVERARSDDLIDNMLPGRIAAQLKAGASDIADAHDQVSVLFADIVGFTKYSAEVSPAQLVRDLNAVFRRFDALAAEHGVEKIKTIGDAYMVAAGVPTFRHDHAAALARFALALREVAAAIPRQDGTAFGLRIGIHYGQAVAGVIGTARLAYDLWGDTVNTASRMESHGEPGRIQVSAETAALLGEGFALQPRGEVEVKGKGLMSLYYLETTPSS
ncbi:MAG: adenylate/guanylate cyclase domain-containing protein [Deltaproteobacteria bacterium]|nr:adenylate/guanylate cyclase domain-containing protein [Deltaproteobacteria bacterium]